MKSRADAELEGIHIPSSVEEYCIKHRPIGSQSSDTNFDLCDDWYDDDDYDEDDDNDDHDVENECFDADDSGTEDN